MSSRSRAWQRSRARTPPPYAVSPLICLPGGMAEQPSAATGTVMRARAFRDYATRAGFSEVTVLPFEPGFQRFYRVTP